MQVATVSEAATSQKRNTGKHAAKDETGQFDAAMAMVYALLSQTPVEEKKDSLPGKPGNLRQVDPSEQLEGQRTGLPWVAREEGKLPPGQAEGQRVGPPGVARGEGDLPTGQAGPSAPGLERSRAFMATNSDQHAPAGLSTAAARPGHQAGGMNTEALRALPQTGENTAEAVSALLGDTVGDVKEQALLSAQKSLKAGAGEEKLKNIDTHRAGPSEPLPVNQAASPDGKGSAPAAETIEVSVRGSVAAPQAAADKKGGSDHNPGENNSRGSAQADAVQNSGAPSLNSNSSARSSDASSSVKLPELGDRILQEIREILANPRGRQQTHVQLKLEPEHLGHLTIKMFFHKNELSVHFHTKNSYVKEVIEGSIGQLKESLGLQDLKLNDAFVFTGNEDRGGAGREPGERKGPFEKAQGQNGRHELEAQRLIDPVNLAVKDSSQVDYLI